MEQRFIARAVFQRMLRNEESLEDVDQELLKQAIIAGLDNQDGSARGAVSNVDSRLSFEEINPLLPAIYVRDFIIAPTDSGNEKRAAPPEPLLSPASRCGRRPVRC